MDSSADPTPKTDVHPRRRVMVVDDAASQRRLLRRLLEGWGYDVLEASNGKSALELHGATPLDFVICDWMMPGLSGPDLCRALRKNTTRPYVYLIMLTSRTETVEGLSAGADEFIVKPPQPSTLRARLKTGERVLDLQQTLLQQGRDIARARDRIQTLYDTLDQDLREAAKLQSALLPPREAHFDGASIAIKVQPTGHVGGDLVGYFEIGSRILAYTIDVSGHGVSSALLASRLSNSFGAKGRDRALIFEKDQLREPADIAARLNAAMVAEIDTDLYFTMALVVFDPSTGIVECVQAGHPTPAILKRNRKVRFEGTGGPPVGLLGGMKYTSITFQLFPGERLFLYSDGLTECENIDGEELGECGLAAILEEIADRSGAETLDDVMWKVSNFVGAEGLKDDASILMLVRH